MIFLYFIAGFFIPALPWAPIASVFTTAIAFAVNPTESANLAAWWQRSPSSALSIIAWKGGLSVAADTLAMLFANWLHGAL